jgi:DNA-directed RNA polymerase specialized sigma24 family protein
MLRAAFRDLHAARLHGFALLLTLGDRDLAARLAADAIAEGLGRAATLRHPERAAAWLRSRVVRAARRRGAGRRIQDHDREATLVPLGVDAAAFRALAALRVDERAALVAAEVERLAPLDLELILGSSGPRARRRVADARERYVARYVASATERPTGGVARADETIPPGTAAGVGERVTGVVERTFTRRSR